jgi:hypothetical protein
MIHPRQILATLLLLALAITAQAQTAGQLAYDLYNGSIFEQKTLSPSEGLYLKWENGLLVNASASGGTWGSITGTLTNQTDLQTALDAKLANSDLFNLSEDGSGNGRLRLWDETDSNWRDMTAIDGGVSFSGDIYVTGTVGAGNISGNNTGDQDLSTYIQDGDTLTTGLTFPFNGLRVINDDAPPHVLRFMVQGVGQTADADLIFDINNASRAMDLAGDLTVSANATISGNNTGDITLAGTPDYITLTNQVLTRNAIDLAADVTGTLGVANGGTGATTLTANNVLLGNGTSAPLEVAPGASGNTLTSDGTTWTSTAPATTNPAGSGSELQFRSSGTAFGALTNSSVSGGAITLGAAEALGTTSTARLTLANTTAAAAGAQQVSPSLVLEGQGWKTTAAAASQTVRFRENILPVQGTTNPSATWQLQSEINNSGTWTNRVTMTTPGVFAVSGDSNTITLDAKDSNNTISATRHMNITPGNGWTLFLNASTQMSSGSTFGFGSDVVLARDAANTLAQRNGTNAQTFRLYETDSGANDEYLEISAASGTNVIRPQATGTGTASVVRYHTTTAVFWTSGSGSPESVVTAPVGSIYTDTAGGAATTLYVKESGTGSTGWIAK